MCILAGILSASLALACGTAERCGGGNPTNWSDAYGGLQTVNVVTHATADGSKSAFAATNATTSLTTAWANGDFLKQQGLIGAASEGTGHVEAGGVLEQSATAVQSTWAETGRENGATFSRNGGNGEAWLTSEGYSYGDTVVVGVENSAKQTLGGGVITFEGISGALSEGQDYVEGKATLSFEGEYAQGWWANLPSHSMPSQPVYGPPHSTPDNNGN